MATRRLGGAAALALAIAGCGSNDAADDPGAGANEAALNRSAAEAPAKPSALPTDAAGFVTRLGASGLFEIRSSALARQKASSADLRSFAQRLEREHGQSSAALRRAAAGVGITAEPKLDADQRALLGALERASGAAFDTMYIDQQRMAHQNTLMMLQNYVAGGDDEALKAFAEKAQSMVEQHTDALNYMRK